jgi:hypothetical protein
MYSKHPVMRAAMAKVANAALGGALRETFTQPSVLAPMIVSGGLAVAGGVHSLASKLMQAREKNQNFKEMLKLTPVLRDKDQVSVKRYYNSLHRVNPHFMGDPLVAGALVYRAIDAQESLGGMHQPSSALAGMVGELAQGRSNFANALDKETHNSRYGGPMDSIRKPLTDVASHVGNILEKGSPLAQREAAVAKAEAELPELEQMKLQRRAIEAWRLEKQHQNMLKEVAKRTSSSPRSP